MANTVTLTNLAPEIYKAADIVARESVGFLRAVSLNTADTGGVNAASFGDKIKSIRTPETNLSTSFTPGMTISAASDKSATFDEFALSQTAKDDLPLIGETVRRLNQAGRQAEQFRVDTFAQMIRKAVNAYESYLAGILYTASSRAVGAAGTTPFGSNLNTLNELRQILVDNGAPIDDLNFVMNTTAGVNMRNLTQLQKINEAGADNVLRRGLLNLPLSGFNIWESAGISQHVKGAGAGYDANGGEPVGENSIALDGGTVNVTGVKAGDVVTFNGDTNKYVVKTGLTAVSGSIAVGRPGLRATLADTVEMTIGDTYTPSLGFHRRAVEFATRPADMGEDAAEEVLRVVDPVSQIPFEFRRYAGEGMSKIMFVSYYGGKVWKEEFVATLLG